MMFDHMAYPLWNNQTKENLTENSVDISKELNADIKNWGNEMEKYFNTKLEIANHPTPEIMESEIGHLIENGRTIAKRLKDELGDSADVSYFVESSCKLELM